ncbi:MAG: spore germination protein [Oscillospiraceae bacterium]|nr:spore germination protein [Oscillospiraceae bacterium]
MKTSEILDKLLKVPPHEPERRPRFPGPITAAYLEEIFENCFDFELRQVEIGGGLRASLCFMDGLVSGDAVSLTVLDPLTNGFRFGGCLTEREAAERMMAGAAYGNTVKYRTEADDAAADLLNGFCAVVFDGLRAAVTFEVRTSQGRAVSEPREEKSIKGARESFVEVLKTNTMMVRRHLRDPALKMETVTVGRRTATSVAIVWIEGLTGGGLTAELRRRVERIDIDGLLTAADLEEYVADSPLSPFPQLVQTERPDRFCLNLLEGRAGLLIDGLPLGFLAPGTFAQFFKVTEDRANHFIVASLLTLIRYLSVAVTLFLPAVFVAVAMYHQEMLPAKLMESMIDAKQSVPFPTAVEVMAMLASFELLQEAGMRLPNQLGQAVSIIGALIVGQSAVEASIVSPIAVIIVAFAGIAGYTMPDQDMAGALRLLRFLLLLAAVFAGMFGIAVGGALITYHLCSLESFGVPYMTPLAGRFGGRGLWKLLRPPLRWDKGREPALGPEDRRSRR